jgi:hypothetical protein
VSFSGLVRKEERRGGEDIGIMSRHRRGLRERKERGRSFGRSIGRARLFFLPASKPPKCIMGLCVDDAGVDDVEDVDGVVYIFYYLPVISADDGC